MRKADGMCVCLCVCGSLCPSVSLSLCLSVSLSPCLCSKWAWCQWTKRISRIYEEIIPLIQKRECILVCGIMKLFLHIFYKFLILLHTENGRVKATLQILYSQYCIWDLFGIHLRFVCFRPRKNNQLCIQNHGQGIHSAKMGVVLRLKIPQFPQNFGFLKKKLSP